MFVLFFLTGQDLTVFEYNIVQNIINNSNNLAAVKREFCKRL